MLWMGIWVHPYYTVIPVRVGIKFWKIGVGVRRGPNDNVVSWLRLQTTIDCIPHSYWMYKVIEHLHMLWMGNLGAPLHCYTHAGWGQFLENWGKVEPKSRCGVMVEAVNHH